MNIETNIKTLKSITSKNFEIALFELSNGQYIIGYIKNGMLDPVLSESLNDYNTATFLFDVKLKELEGH